LEWENYRYFIFGTRIENSITWRNFKFRDLCMFLNEWSYSNCVQELNMYTFYIKSNTEIYRKG